MVCGGLPDPQVREEQRGETTVLCGRRPRPNRAEGGVLPGAGGEEAGACRDYDDFFSRTKYTVPEGVLDENGRMEAFNNDLVIRYLDRVVVKDDGYEVVFKAGVTVEVGITNKGIMGGMRVGIYYFPTIDSFL